MADRVELFERRNRVRIVALVVLATLNYIVAVVMAAIALGIGLAVAILFPRWRRLRGRLDTLPFFAIGIGVVAVGSAVIGILVGLVRIPFLRAARSNRRCWRKRARAIIAADEQTEVKNLLEGLAIAERAAASAHRGDRRPCAELVRRRHAPVQHGGRDHDRPR